MYTSRMFDMWSTVSTKLEQSNAIQSNIQTTNLQNQSSGSIKGKRVLSFPKIDLHHILKIQSTIGRAAMLMVVGHHHPIIMRQTTKIFS